MTTVILPVGGSIARFSYLDVSQDNYRRQRVEMFTSLAGKEYLPRKWPTLLAGSSAPMP